MENRSNKQYKNIDAYIAGASEEVRPVLEKIRETIRAAAPEAQETSTAVPVLLEIFVQPVAVVVPPLRVITALS